MDLLISLIFRVEDYGDGTKIQIHPTHFEVARSSIFSNAPKTSKKMCEFVDQAIRTSIASHQKSFRVEDVETGRIRIYILLSHSLLKLD